MISQSARNALAALQRGSWQEAEAICADTLRRNPGDAHALLVLGNVRAYSGDTLAAEPLLERARAGAPKDIVILNSLGGVYGANGKLQKARVVLEDALKIDGHFAWAHQNLGNVLSELGERGEARRHYEAALQAKPDYAEAIAGLADLAEKDYRIDEAKQLAQRALALSPQLVSALIVLGRIDLRLGDHEDLLARLGSAAEAHMVRPRNRATLLNLIGQAHEGRGVYDKAFAAFVAANETKRAAHASQYARSDSAISIETISRLTEFVGSADLRSWSNKSIEGDRDPVFLVGFPRSGTTLLDQALASHQDIETVEEQEGLDDALQPLVLAPDALSRWPTLSAEDIAHFRRAYWRRSELTLGGPPCRRVFIDKMPLYSALLPLIYRLFPRAKILLAIRDPRDVAVSCFVQDFAMNAGMFHFLSLETTVRYYDAVMRLVMAARRHLPLRVHTIKYEDLVGDFDHTIGAALDFLDLPWDGAVRNYAETAKKRVIRTPSARQVVRPIYSSSIGRWRHYETQMQPQLPILNHWARILDYQVD